MREFIDIIKSDRKSKVLFVITIGVLFICTLSYSLSMFSNSREGDLANIKVNGLSFNMTTNSGESDDRILKLKANTLESFNVILTNLNSMDVKYELIYEICSDSSCSSILDKLPDDVVFGINYDSKGLISDTLYINGNTNIILLSNNSTDTDYYIKLNLNAGYSWNELALVNQIHEYHKDIDFIAYVDGVEQEEFPNTCFYDYTYKTYTKGVETSDSEVSLSCSNGVWKILVNKIPSKVKVWFTPKAVNAVELLTNIETTDTGKTYLRYDGMTDSSVSSNGTGNLRYYGGSETDVDAVPNYISFNNELWRIIGVFEVYNASTWSYEKAVKIIRNDSIGMYSWDTCEESINDGYGINEWSQADLMEELNNEYLGNYREGHELWFNGISNTQTATYDKSQSIKSEYQQYIMNARWNLGGVDTTEGVSAAQIYEKERGTNVFQHKGYSGDDTVTRTTLWDGKIALMYPSDYAFASNDETCLNDLYNCNNDNNRSGNWLYLNMKTDNGFTYSEWLLPSGIGSQCWNGICVCNVLGNDTDDRNGMVRCNSIAINNTLVRPTLYLTTNTLIKSGNGTSSNPYQLSL